MTQEITLSAEGYNELAIILRDAFLQASEGKGRERHANDLPFDQQPMQTLSDVFDSDKGMAFQVVKKLREGLDMPEFERLERELLGSIVYTAGIILWHKRRRTRSTVVVEDHPIPAELREGLIAGLNSIMDQAEVLPAAPQAEQPDMSNPANWLPGDMLTALGSSPGSFTKGNTYELRHRVGSKFDSVRIERDDEGEQNGWTQHMFSWHSRPAK